MLKELFVLRSGTPLFYYSQKELSEREIDQFLLSSGLLGAISSFSEEARSSQLQSFSSNNETFVFSKLPQFDANIVGAFDNETSMETAKVILEMLKVEIIRADILDNEDRIDLQDPAKVEFAKIIPKFLSRISDTDEKIEHYNQVIKHNSGIFLGFVLDLDDHSIIFKFARPLPLFKNTLVKDVNLLYKVGLNMLNKLHLGNDISSITLANSSKTLSTASNGVNTSFLASNLASISDIFHATHDMVYTSGEFVEGQRPSGIYSLEDRQLTHISGEEFLGENANIFIMTVINNIDKLFSNVFNQKFTDVYFSIRRENHKNYVLKFQRDSNNSDEIIINKIEFDNDF